MENYYSEILFLYVANKIVFHIMMRSLEEGHFQGLQQGNKIKNDIMLLLLIYFLGFALHQG